MPHVIRAGRVNLEAAWRGLPRTPWRWGKVVAKIEGCFLGVDAGCLLVAGVVVEYGRPLHPVLIASFRGDETALHLWAHASVECTEAVKRFLVQVSRELTAFGAGDIVTTNLRELAGEDGAT